MEEFEKPNEIAGSKIWSNFTMMSFQVVISHVLYAQMQLQIFQVLIELYKSSSLCSDGERRQLIKFSRSPIKLFPVVCRYLYLNFCLL